MDVLLWEEYQKYYEEAINKTSKTHAPWFVIPADNKPAARLIVAQILLETLTAYKEIDEPELDDEIKAMLDDFMEQLKAE